MALLTLKDVSLAYGIRPLLSNVSLHINKGERLCLIGRNGEGKSSLLNIIAGTISPDSGEVILDSGIRLSVLDQDIFQSLDLTVYDVVASGLLKIGEKLSAYYHLLEQEHNAEILQQLGKLQQELDALDAWRLDQKVMTIISKLDLPKDQKLSELSGGWGRRALLGRALVSEPDLLLLDEPTNHLDINAILWLEDFLLKQFNGAVLFITHDRAFLEKLATKIIELDRGNLTEFPGSFSNYQRRKQEMLHAEHLERELFDKQLAQEEVWIRKGIEARRTRNEGRVRALIEMRQQYSERIDRQGQARLNFEEGEKSGRKIIEAHNISYHIDAQPIVVDFNITIMRGDRIGLIGPNGIGKSTLLKILFGQISPEKGTVEIGTKLNIAYFDQMRTLLDPEKSVMNNVMEGSEFIEINGKKHHIIGWLQDFMFSPEKARSPVKSLSGGERNRLLLAKLFTRPANVLVLDEPTNDLDMETLEVLENLLVQFEGTLLIVSHDREFLDQTVTSTLVFEGEGKIHQYVGGYTDWFEQRGEEYFAKKTTFEEKNTPENKPQSPSGTQPKSIKLTFNEKRELDILPEKMEALEAEIEQLSTISQDPEFYRSSPEEQKKLLENLARLNESLEEAFERWEYLEKKMHNANIF